MADSTLSSVLVTSDDLPVRTEQPVHSGKVRSVYFLGAGDSRRLIEERNYDVAAHSRLALMVISDRLSAFDCLWHAATLPGVPGKGAALNAIAAHWFARIAATTGRSHHLLEAPHPLAWIVRQARPVRVEAIARRYLTGSLWRAYSSGQREVAGVQLRDGLQRYARFDELLFTPSTKGVLRGLDGVPETDDAAVSLAALRANLSAFGFRHPDDLNECESALREGFAVIEDGLAASGRLLVDTKFEFGLAPRADGDEELIYMDEVGTPDSSRIWERADWEMGAPREHSKEQFREALLATVEDPDLLLNPGRMNERSRYARDCSLPDSLFEDLAQTYREQCRGITGRDAPASDCARESLLQVLSDELGLLR